MGKLKINIRCSGCLELLSGLDDSSVDLILTDPPYGVTAAKWDIAENFAEVFSHFIRVVTEVGVIVVFGQEPFSSMVRYKFSDLYRYDLVWKKQKPSNFQLMNYQPGRVTENIMVFAKLPACYTKWNRHMTYNPQMVERTKPRKANVKIYGEAELLHDYNTSDNHKTYTQRHPTNILEFPTVSKGKLHPTQKPTELLEWLIKSYSNDGDTVLDPYMGSGSTGVACINTGRNFIGCDNMQKYYDITSKRLKETWEN